jgi:GNAT superfamily N-acetyltransferase
MRIETSPLTPATLTEYATIPIRFEVRSRLRVVEEAGGLAGLRLIAEPVQPPYVKDYDAGEAGEPCGPLRWPLQFDVSRWALFLARSGDLPVGGATLAHATPAVHLLDGRSDLAVLWDLRVRPGWRGQGIGTALFGHAAAWARERACRQMKVETQNINVPACRFYSARGCHLGAIHRHAYAASPALADEVMLLWYLDL